MSTSKKVFAFFALLLCSMSTISFAAPLSGGAGVGQSARAQSGESTGVGKYAKRVDPYIVLGSFSSAESAIEFAAKKRESGIAAGYIKTAQPGFRWRVVARSDEFAPDAASALRRAVSRGIVGPWIIRIPNEYVVSKSERLIELDRARTAAHAERSVAVVSHSLRHLARRFGASHPASPRPPSPVIAALPESFLGRAVPLIPAGVAEAIHPALAEEKAPMPAPVEADSGGARSALVGVEAVESAGKQKERAIDAVLTVPAFSPARWTFADGSKVAFTAEKNPSFFYLSVSERGGKCAAIVELNSLAEVPAERSDYILATKGGLSCEVMYVVPLTRGVANEN